MKSQDSSAKSLKTDETLDLLKSRQTEDTVFIIGGGPSVKTLIPNVSILNDRDVICCNNAYKLFPDALCTHFADRAWLQWHIQPEHDLFNNFSGVITSCAPLRRQNLLADKVCYFDKVQERIKFSLNENALSGRNAGHQAVNLAYHIGYRQIVLIGFDMNVNVDKTHWHDDHKRTTNKEVFVNNFIPDFNEMNKHREQLGLKIFNLNRQSGLRCFPFADLDDFI